MLANNGRNVLTNHLSVNTVSICTSKDAQFLQLLHVNTCLQFVGVGEDELICKVHVDSVDWSRSGPRLAYRD